MEKGLTALGMLLVLIVILYLTYICTRYVGRRAGGIGSGGTSQNMRILEQRMLGRDSSIAMVQVGERVLLVGISPQSITLLTEIDDESILKSIPPVTEEASAIPPFKDFLLRFKDRK